MNKPLFPFLLGLCLFVSTAPSFGQDKLFLHNGDMLSGRILSYDPESISIETDYGQFDISLAFIRGAFVPGDMPNKDAAVQSVLAAKQAALLAAPVEIEAEQVKDKAVTTVAAQADKGLFMGAALSGNVNLGFDMKTGNSETSGVNIDASAKAVMQDHSFKVGVDYNREEDDGDVSVDNSSLSLAHDYFYTERWFIGSTARFEQDDIDRLDIRSSLAFGLGYQPYKHDDLNLKFVAGPGYLYEEFDDGSDDSAVTANWAAHYDQKFYDDLFRLFHDHELNAPSDDFGAYLFQSKTGLRVPIKQGVVASGQVDFDWDNDPALGTVKDDTIYSIKLGYEWP